MTTQYGFLFREMDVFNRLRVLFGFILVSPSSMLTIVTLIRTVQLAYCFSLNVGCCSNLLLQLRKLCQALKIIFYADQSVGKLFLYHMLHYTFNSYIDPSYSGDRAFNEKLGAFGIEILDTMPMGVTNIQEEIHGQHSRQQIEPQVKHHDGCSNFS